MDSIVTGENEGHLQLCPPSLISVVHFFIAHEKGILSEHCFQVHMKGPVLYFLTSRKGYLIANFVHNNTKG